MKVIYTDNALPTTNYQNKKRYSKLCTHYIADLFFTYMFYIKPCALPISLISFNILLHLRHFQFLVVTHPMQHDRPHNIRNLATVSKYHYKETKLEPKVRNPRLHLKLIFKLYLYDRLVEEVKDSIT